MTNREFYDRFMTEEQCLTHFKSIREKEGVVCEGCGGKEHYWLKAKKQFQCKKCRFRTGIKKGTLLECSNLPIKKWYEAFHLVTMSKKPISAKTVERHLDVHYETAWFLLQKIRIALGRRNKDYVLEGSIEVDECMHAVIELSEEANAEDHQSKTGRGANKAKILVMTSYEEGEDRWGHKMKYLKNAVMEVIDDFSAKSLAEPMKKWISKHSKIYTDKFRSYLPIKKQFPNIDMKVSSGELAEINLPIVHQTIGNFKGDLIGIHRSVSQLHLQNYLDEFCYKLNRRFMLEAKYCGKSVLENIALQSVRFKW